jgi:hypothetical protein
VLVPQLKIKINVRNLQSRVTTVGRMEDFAVQIAGDHYRKLYCTKWTDIRYYYKPLSRRKPKIKLTSGLGRAWILGFRVISFRMLPGLLKYLDKQERKTLLMRLGYFSLSRVRPG